MKRPNLLLITTHILFHFTSFALSAAISPPTPIAPLPLIAPTTPITRPIQQIPTVLSNDTLPPISPILKPSPSPPSKTPIQPPSACHPGRFYCAHELHRILHIPLVTIGRMYYRATFTPSPNTTLIDIHRYKCGRRCLNSVWQCRNWPEWTGVDFEFAGSCGGFGGDDGEEDIGRGGFRRCLRGVCWK